ncbi:MAG: GH25 family lysozyme [Lachnospira sp.]|nr:GH25 family lysozyme [Lachnospira sp.]
MRIRNETFMKRIMAVILTCVLMLTMIVSASAYMIDVSDNNGTINWDAVAPEVEDGVIIRLGYGSDYESQDDKQFLRNVEECERLGIPYGIYLYSYALDYDDIQSEIAHAKRLASQCNPTLGVWFDMEDADGYKARHGINVYKKGAMLTDFCIYFVQNMRDAGYTTGVYANYNYFTNVLDLNRLRAVKGFQMWLAHWGIDEPSLPCKIWQFGAYEVNGYEYDGDIYYKDYVEPIKPTYEESAIEESAGYVRDEVNAYYQVQINGNQWLSVVNNYDDFAGIDGQAITGVAISVDKGYCIYRVHVNGRWLGYIDSRNTNINDYYNGYAGNGRGIDAVELYYHTESDIAGQSGYKYAIYRVQPQDAWGYFAEQRDASTKDGMDGYAGSFSRVIDRLQIRIDY